MITATALTAAALLLLTGAVLHRGLAVALLRIDGVTVGPDGAISERDLLFIGLLPAIVIVGTIGIYLALLGLFRADLNAALLVVAVAWRRHDLSATLSTLGELLRDLWQALRDLRLLTLLAVAAYLGLAAIYVFNAELPDATIDVWVFQIPLAKSLISHNGFLFPQAAGLFYSAQPFFVNLLFAEVMQYADHFIAAHIMNITIFLSFLLGLLAFAHAWRAATLLLIVWFFGGSFLFAPDTATALTDLPRSCFSAGAILFAYRYIRFGASYYLIICGLLAGAAISSKYTELLTPCLIGVMLIPQLLKGRRAWFDALACAGMAFIVGAYWYAKNWIFLGNPVYPLFFGHPGISDEVLAAWLTEMSQAYDPALRSEVRNLLTVQGWRDFGFVLGHWFFVAKSARLAAVLVATGLFRRTPKLIFLVCGTAALFVIWYVAMFNTFRFAMPAYLLFFSTAVIAWADIATYVHSYVTQGRWAKLNASGTARAARVATALLLTIILGALIARDGIEPFAARWIDIDYLRTVVRSGSADPYLNAHRQGYEIYRYISANNLHTVLQPFDAAAPSYAAAYSGGRDGGWILDSTILPAPGDDIDGFLRRNEIRYFVSRPPLTGNELEYMDRIRSQVAFEVVDKLIPRSQILLTDAFGWSLYQIIDRSDS